MESGENVFWTYRVVLHGHTDERGTREYNMALGERRAGAVQRFSSCSSGTLSVATRQQGAPFFPCAVT